MSELFLKVISYWESIGAQPEAGVAQLAIDDFERRFGIPLTEDVASFYRLTNGIVGDANLFAVWPLQKIVPVSVGPGDSHRSYFVFADFMIRSHDVAVHLRTGDHQAGPVVRILDSEVTNIASSFSDFWARYLENPLKAVA